VAALSVRARCTEHGVVAVSGAVEQHTVLAGINFLHGTEQDRAFWGTAAQTVTLGSWQHVAVVYDKDSLTNDATIYLNGADANATEAVAPTTAMSSDTAKRPGRVLHCRPRAAIATGSAAADV
jgi:hypothetical protein